ncbi:ABC transporter ATP-binding protein [Saccharopolyspora subtropica]|uniref:ABC transporter ATP-binding protein n=1 Tax=Saccharopolyspora thermophila TaxID=89367 RepID=A0A917JZ21_9PSEU|nr:ABC transporter ATP-binding protein [Saccharopolyspora subtropica]GGI89751.1 ABC transporter ATP-binding protein [Saccharopolyspora subtropica]
MSGLVNWLLRPAEGDTEGLVEHAPVVRVREVFRRFWPDARPFRGWLMLSLLLVLISPLLDTAAIWLFKVLIDDVLTPRNFAAFPAVAAAYAVITLVGGAIDFGGQYLAAWIGENFLHRLRTRVFRHLHTLSISFFDRRRIGDTLSRLTGDVGAIESLVLSGVTETFSSLVKIVLFTGVLFFLDWRLALVSLVAVPLFWTIARFFARRIKLASREVRGRSGSISTVAEESLGNAPLIQAYGREGAEVDRFVRQSRGSVGANLASTRIGALFSPMVDLMEVLGVMAILGVGILELSAGRITLGGLLAFLVYLSQLYSPVRNLGQLTNTIFAAAASAERIIDLLDQRPLVRSPANPVPLGRTTGHLQVEQVDFRYPGTTADVLHGVTFQALPGETTAVVGASGAGKSTLTKLLLRFYDPTRGRILLDGHDLRELDLDELRANIAIVLQETLLLDGTVADNILAGRPGATHEQMVRAAEAADAHEFILALPDGYDTRVGQRGRLLSGGQRQRIAIARAMIRDAPILLLDEPTTSLDADAAERILAPLRRLMAGRTTIVISHNLMTVRDAQQIVYLDRGVITEAGTHEELLANDNGYAHLYRLHHPDARPAAPVQPNGQIAT